MSPFSALFRLITGVEPAVTVSAGEKVTLVAVVGTNWVPVTWKLPGKGEVVQNYDPTLATNQLTPLGQTIDAVPGGFRFVRHYLRVGRRRQFRGERDSGGRERDEHDRVCSIICSGAQRHCECDGEAAAACGGQTLSSQTIIKPLETAHK